MYHVFRKLTAFMTSPWMVACVIILAILCPHVWATVTASQLCTAMVGKSYPVTQGYLAYCTCNATKDKLHAGIDYGVPAGTNVRAVIGGTVTYAGGSCGSVGVYYDDPDPNKKATVFYLHLQNIKVKTGDKIQFGTVIGQVGNACTSKVHLHIEVRRGYATSAVGEASGTPTSSLTYDPLKYF